MHNIIKKNNMRTIGSQLFTTGPFPLDGKRSISSSFEFKTINELIKFGGKTAFSEGMLVEDYTNAVVWQLYLDGDDFKAKIFDGRFRVKSVATTAIALLSGEKTINGATCSADDDVLLANEITPHMNGVWTVKEGSWVRNPLFSIDTGGINFLGTTFVVEDGDFKNSQWKFTTVGDITMSNNPADFSSATWLDFEAIDPSKNIINYEISSSGSISRFHKHTFVNAASGDVTALLMTSIFLNEEYLIQKIDRTSNLVLVNLSSDRTVHVLTEENDWAKIIVTTFSPTAKYYIISNRINKTIIPSDATANGKISDVSSGYLTYQIKFTSTTEIYLNVGTTDGGSDIESGLYIDAGETETLIVNASTISEIWLSSADWNSSTVSTEILIVKEG
jgi:hypothetical protein